MDIQDLKDRYYSVCRKLVRNRPWAGDEQSKAQLLASFQFDKDRETTRKKYITSLENRTPEQIAEEQALYIEIKRLEQNERRFRKERDDLLRTLAGVDSGLPDLPVDEEGLTGGPGGGIGNGNGNGSMFDQKRKKGYYDLDSPSTPSNIIALGPPIVRRPQTAKNVANGT
jgi:DNA methyltransferase 1-associated protein 1